MISIHSNNILHGFLRHHRRKAHHRLRIRFRPQRRPYILRALRIPRSVAQRIHQPVSFRCDEFFRLGLRFRSYHVDLILNLLAVPL